MKSSLKAEIIKQWETNNKPAWSTDDTLKIAINCDKKFTNPHAPRFRKAVEQNDKKYLKVWIQGCRFPWLKEKIKKQLSKPDSKIKNIGDGLLYHINFVLDTASAGDETLRFKLNRWVYTRLHQKEIQSKRPIKKQLWESGNKQCAKCGEPFNTKKNIEIHRVNPDKIYSIENCVLVCKACHEKM